MKHFGTILVVLASLACLAALAISIYPGMLGDLFFMAFLFSLVAGPVIGLVGASALVWLAWRGHLPREMIPFRHAGAVMLMVLATCALLTFSIPRRIAFATSRSAFQHLVEEVREPDNDRVRLNEWLGFFYVDEYAVDRRGGTYFRVHSGPDGIGPDLMSYGFCQSKFRRNTIWRRALPNVRVRRRLVLVSSF